ncbi:MAG: mannitol dehydrogenase family protein [Pseudomonadota bacterium]
MGRIVHIGLGNFARAHLLDYTADVGGWDVVGVSLRSAAVRDGLAKQGFAYDLCVQGQGAKQIDVLSDVLVAPENPSAVLDAMAHAEIISATVTEKGYYLDSEGQLDLDDPVIQAELSGQGPRSLIGYLVQALARRCSPVTVLSCDNRVGNGDALRRAARRFAKAAGLSVDWSVVTFPNAMVDRITPATTDALRHECGDPMAVPTEAFREWVIEDNFAGPRPDWPDVQFVADVAPHELRKLRMLNGAHSFMAYTGLLKGLTYVHEAVTDVQLRRQVEWLMAEAGATLPDEVQAQVPAYARALLRRFENPQLQHRLDQIAMDGSQKLPYRFIGTLRDGPAPTVAEGVQAWISFCMAQVAQGRTPDDPKAAEIAAAVTSSNPRHALLKLVGAADLAPIIAE